MKELVLALEFRGSAGPVPGSDKKMHAKTSATSQTLRSVLTADAIQASVESAGGGSASFESEVEIVGEGHLAGAQGLITSNFTVGPQGEVVDDEFARLFVP
jgi:hypothetical protein